MASECDEGRGYLLSSGYSFISFKPSCVTSSLVILNINWRAIKELMISTAYKASGYKRRKCM